MSTLNGATLMITGGTGSFGNTVLKHFLTSDVGEVRIFSRDEKKQDDMLHELQAKYPDHANKVKFHIGDVRNAQSIRDAMHGVDYVFHAAANFFPWKRCAQMLPEPITCFMPLLIPGLSGWFAYLRIKLLIRSMPWGLVKR